MTNTPAYDVVAQQYADDVRSLFAPATPSFTERSRSQPGTLIVAERAERLAPVSATLTQAASTKLAAADAATRLQASTQLLAKALTDLQVSAVLLQAAQDEEAGVDPAIPGQVERSVTARSGARSDIEEQLRLLLGDDSRAVAVPERGARPSHDLPSARPELTTTASDTLLLIKQRASATGQDALSGLIGLGMGQVAQAAGVVGINIAETLGLAEHVSRLYTLCREFALHAYDSLLALLGPSVAQVGSNLVVAWLNELQQGQRVGSLLEKIYDTAHTEQAVRQMIEHSTAPLDTYAVVIKDVGNLGDTYGKQINLVDKLMKGMRLFGGVPAAVIPQGQLLLAAAYIVLSAYVILAGADLVGAQGLKLLDRTPGVRRTIAAQLAAA